MAKILIVLAACLVASCNTSAPGSKPDGPGSDPNHDPSGIGNEEQQYVSGERIRARVATTADGAKQFLGWHDTELGVDCSMKDAGDGPRCLPDAGLAQYYADSGCTQRLAATGCTPPDFFYTVPSTFTCPVTPSTYYQRGTEVVSPSNVYFLSGVVCSSLPANSAVRYFLLGGAVSLSDFVAFDLGVE